MRRAAQPAAHLRRRSGTGASVLLWSRTEARGEAEQGEDGVGGSGLLRRKDDAYEVARDEGISETQKRQRIMDEVARELPGKEAAGEEEDELGGGDSGLSFAIPWSRTKRATRRTFGWSWIWTGSSPSTVTHDGSGAGVRSSGRKMRERERGQVRMGSRGAAGRCST